MENKINIAELLKDCPQGMELDCTMLDDVVFEKISFDVPNYPIVLKRLKTNTTIYLTKYGQYSDPEDYKCVIFPKGKTTWEGFVPPCKFKDGDVVEPKFKVGDRIQNIYNGKQFTITKIYQDYYECDDRYVLAFENQDIWELTSDKFDINTLVPFESRVLVRDYDDDKWHPGIWGFYDKGATSYPYKLVGDIVRYCIPYEGNEHLLGKTDDCSEFYKNW